MHQAALDELNKFVLQYLKSGDSVLDVGAQDVNGSAKSLLFNQEYTGLDISEGKGVDVVWDTKKMPFKDNKFDSVVCLNTLEHDPTFWNTFSEIIRVCKKKGFIFVQVPSRGNYHAYPVDCWRFMDDGMKALAGYTGITLIDSHVNIVGLDWSDAIGIFNKS